MCRVQSVGHDGGWLDGAWGLGHGDGDGWNWLVGWESDIVGGWEGHWELAGIVDGTGAESEASPQRLLDRLLGKCFFLINQMSILLS